MPAGRRPKPTSIKLLTGNPGKRPLNENEPEPEALDDLKPPPGLDRYGRECWRRYAPELQRIGMLRRVDVPLLMTLCGAYSRWRHGSIALSKLSPLDDQYRQVALTVEKSEQALRMAAIEFGMTPASRSRMDLSWGDRPVDESPMKGLLSGPRRAG